MGTPLFFQLFLWDVPFTIWLKSTLTYLAFKFFFFIVVDLHVLSISALRQSDPVIHIYIFFFSYYLLSCSIASVLWYIQQRPAFMLLIHGETRPFVLNVFHIQDLSLCSCVFACFSNAYKVMVRSFIFEKIIFGSAFIIWKFLGQGSNPHHSSTRATAVTMLDP